MRELNILVLTFERPNQVNHLIGQLESQALKSEWKVTVTVAINGMEDESSACELTSFENGRFSLRVVRWEQRLPLGAARNLALSLMDFQHSSGVLFLDDDVLCPEEYLSQLTRRIDEHPEVSFIGGPNLNFQKSNRFQTVSSLILGRSFITGPISNRYKQGQVKKTSSDLYFILCNLFIRKEQLSLFRFSNSLTSGEENEIISRMARFKVIGLYHPDIYVFHERRPRFTEFLKQVFKYGSGRGQGFSLRFGPVKAVMLFALGAIALGLILLQFPLITSALIGAYVFYLVLCALVLQASSSSFLLISAPVTIYGLHLSYLSGFLTSPFVLLCRMGGKEVIRSTLANLIPKSLAMIVYRGVERVVCAFLSRPDGIQVWSRNSLKAGAIRFLKSDIDLTTFLSRSERVNILLNRYFFIRRLMPLVGELLIYQESRAGLALRLGNPFELSQDPILLSKLNVNGDRQLREAQRLVFILRKIESNIFDLINETNFSFKKWSRYLRQEDSRGLSNLFDLVNKAREFGFSETDVNWIYGQFVGKAFGIPDHKLAKLYGQDKLVSFFIHRFCFLSFKNFESFSELRMKIFIEQLKWEVWGILCTYPMEEKAALGIHLNRLKQFLADSRQEDPDLKEAFSVLEKEVHSFDSVRRS